MVIRKNSKRSNRRRQNIKGSNRKRQNIKGSNRKRQNIKGSNRKRKKMSTRDKCKRYLKKRISENIGLYKSGRFISRKQAIAVSYSQAKKKYSRCRSIFK